MNENDPNSDLAQRERIRYQWMLSRIQGFKSLVVAILVAMLGYVANTIGYTDSNFALGLLSMSAFLLLVSLILGALDAGGAVFYNEKSQEGISKRWRWGMYVTILFAAILIFVAKVDISVKRIDSQPISPLVQPIAPANRSPEEGSR